MFGCDMSTEISVTWDKGQLSPFQAGGFDRATTRALAKAGRDAIRAIRSESSRRVRDRKRIKVRRVNDSLPVTNPPPGADIDELEWRMDVSGAPLRVSDYSFRQAAGGVSVSINTSKRTLIKSAFVATMKSGHTGVFIRRGKSRLPIDELFSTKVSDVFNDSGMIEAVLARGEDTFGATFDRVLPLELDKISG